MERIRQLVNAIVVSTGGGSGSLGNPGQVWTVNPSKTAAIWADDVDTGTSWPIRLTAISTGATDADGGIFATSSGLTITVPDASTFSDNKVLGFYLGVAGTLDIVFAVGDSVLGN
jgi:hypothetical protein